MSAATPAQPKILADMIRSGPMVVAPGAYDCITARLIEQAGYPAVYMTGAGTSAAHGLPDYGLVTMSEMVENARKITGCISVPLLSDSDTGYGNELNAYRTVQEFERAGVQAIHIEDQVFPKKCGHLDDKELVSLEDYVAKIRAAAAARRSKDFMIIARTDARAVAGFDEAVRRANAAADAGADLIFLEAPQTLDEVAKVPQVVKAPCLLNMVLKGKTPHVNLKDAERMGYRITILPGMLISSIIGLCDKMLAEVKATGELSQPYSQTGPGGIFARFGAAEWDERRTAYRDGRSAAKQAAE
ncbi:MAG: oxaloacetate decarboxylase [Hyphomicrobiaceae bacterium]